MNCDEFSSLIDSMLDGELSVESTARASAHCDQCPQCGPQREQFLMLHDRMSNFADTIKVPEDLEKRIKISLTDEVKRNQRTTIFNFANHFKSPKLAAAAALLCLIAAGLYFVTSDNSSRQPKIAQNANVNPIAASDLTTHTQLHIVSRFKYSPDQLPALARQTGFEIKPPRIVGWHLGDVCICSVGKDGQPVAHMTYVSNLPAPNPSSGRKLRNIKILTCYQVLNKHFDASGMSQHNEVAKKPVWSSEVGKLAVAMVKERGVANIFIGAMPVTELVSIAGHS